MYDYLYCDMMIKILYSRWIWLTKLILFSLSVVAIPSPPVFSISGGFYQGAIIVSLSAAEDHRIYYTTDGTVPTDKSALYGSPLSLKITTPVRAIAIRTNEPASIVVTQTYFINEPIHLAVISLVTDPVHLFSDQTGIYVTGKNGIRGACDPVIRNLNQDWERPVNIELYEKSGTLAFNQIAGIKIFGGCSRTRFPQKSFALFARQSYGHGSFDYQIFPDKPIQKFESFLLRSAGDDQVRTFFRDAYTAYALKDEMDIDYMAYRPSVVYINGQYWGIHNVREKINENFLESNYNVPEEYVNLLERNSSEFIGNNDGYDAMLSVLNNRDMSLGSNLEIISKLMDFNQFIDYEVANIHLAEVDWPGNNIKFWNAPNSQYDKWRWILFDRDQTFLPNRVTTNALALASATNGPSWPNPPWSTLILRRLLTNSAFKQRFIQTYAHHMSTSFDSTRLNNILDQFKQGIAAEIPRHISKWGGQLDRDKSETWPSPTFNSVAAWEGHIRDIRSFNAKREVPAVDHLKSMFNLGERSELTIVANSMDAGEVKLFEKKLQANYKGRFFNGIPLKLYPFARKGYLFSHWIVDGNKLTNEVLEFTPTKKASIVAHFLPNAIQEKAIVINEINYNSPASPDAGDWLELYNPNGTKVNISGWRLSDADTDDAFIFKPNTFIEGYGYLVICESVFLFDAIHPNLYNRLGGLTFKLSNSGEVIKLYTMAKELVDSVNYLDKRPWAEPADGDGPTLELINWALDNTSATSWRASSKNGTPGKANSVFTITKDESIKYFSLHQNYPNPVNNGYTTISYRLHQKGFVHLSIHNALGQDIEQINYGIQMTGDHEVYFETGHLTPGMYFMRLQYDGRYVQALKMLVQ